MTYALSVLDPVPSVKDARVWRDERMLVTILLDPLAHIPRDGDGTLYASTRGDQALSAQPTDSGEN